MQGDNAPGKIPVVYSPSDIDQALATRIDYASSLGALTFLFYDICITLADEVKFIWPKPWTRTKILFLFIRYAPLLVQISTLLIGSPELTPQFDFAPRDCFVWQVYQGAITVLLFAAVDYVLILRVCALYHNDATIRKVVFAAFALELCGMGLGLGLSLGGIEFDSICLTTSVPTTLIIYGGATLLFQTFLFILTVVKFVGAVREGWGDTPLVGLVMRDGAWAFFLLFLVVGGDASLYALKNHTFASVLFGWLLTVFSFSGYHVLLNLDRLNDAPSLPTSQSSTHDSPHQFTTRIVTDRDTHHAYALTSLNAGPSGLGSSG
ncbi:hypothetical protein DFH08DRAFT_110058 [Mycena albidolilacea]|uniref:DUF6533 domain-containing protein n=1 Tax=Mycena albidolilacea TaxID=1033008 RepID=A0AAD7A6A2_9AGAR|nr:hypothetical protein DFH08DRAFT_110058 [Mycena albidolilacea]